MPIKETKNIHTQSTVTVRNKKDRITMALQGLFQQGKYYLKPEHEEARDELLRHPLGKHDDLVDAMASCEQIIVPTYFAFEEKDPDYVEEEPVARGMTGYGDY